MTALAAIGPLVLAAEGPRVLFYKTQGNSSQFAFLTSRTIFNDQAIHGISVYASSKSKHVIFAIWGGPLVRFLSTKDVDYDDKSVEFAVLADRLHLSSVARSPDWILDLSFAPTAEEESLGHKILRCAAVTAHNALVEITLPGPMIGLEPNDNVNRYASLPKFVP